MNMFNIKNKGEIDESEKEDKNERDREGMR